MMAGKHSPDFWGTNKAGKRQTLSAKKVKKVRKKIAYAYGGEPWSNRPNAPQNRNKPRGWW